MKKIVFFFLMTILIASCHQEELSSVPDEPTGGKTKRVNMWSA